jgi:excisionase family DNA binding protein
MEPLLDAIDVAKILRVSKRTFESLVALGKGPPAMTIGRQRRWRQRDVDEWLEAMLQKPETASEK